MKYALGDIVEVKNGDHIKASIPIKIAHPERYYSSGMTIDTPIAAGQILKCAKDGSTFNTSQYMGTYVINIVGTITRKASWFIAISYPLEERRGKYIYIRIKPSQKGPFPAKVGHDKKLERRYKDLRGGLKDLGKYSEAKPERLSPKLGSIIKIYPGMPINVYSNGKLTGVKATQKHAGKYIILGGDNNLSAREVTEGWSDKKGKFYELTGGTWFYAYRLLRNNRASLSSPIILTAYQWDKLDNTETGLLPIHFEDLTVLSQINFEASPAL